MRTLLPLALVATCWLAPTSAAEPGGASKDTVRDAIFKELSDGLLKCGQRAISARLEVEYWHKKQWSFFSSSVRKPVKTKDGKAAELIFITAPANSIPGNAFSMAFLLVDKCIVDWVSCWTSNRIANQELLLEDVDGDGFSDVAFRASAGWWGLLDERQHSRPGDSRKWLYAFAVTARGFESLFPNTERDLKVKLSCDTAGEPVVLQVKGIPESLRERRMVECTVSATNTSNKEVLIKPAEWFSLDIHNGGYFTTYGPPDNRTVLKPGETVSQTLVLYVTGKEEDITMRWKFVRESLDEHPPQQ